jgi:competence protein ComEC
MSPSIFTSVINSYLPEPQASLLNGIIFGVPLKVSKEFYQDLRTVGLLHIVVLSGINITLLSTIILSITRSFGKYVSIVITILTIIIFICFVGFQAPIIRAGIMGILTLVAILYERRTIILYNLVISVFVIVVFWPKWLSSLSFQLSYGATFGLLFFGAKTKSNDSLFGYIKNDIRTSLAAQVFTAPLIFFHFKQISLISPIANLFVSYTIAPIMILGFLTAILGKIHFVFGLIPSWICYGILTYVIFVIKTLAKIPYANISF